MRYKLLIYTFISLLAIFFISCKKSNTAEIIADSVVSTTTFKVTSTAFVNNGTLPKLYTCDSVGISPKLSWVGAPAGTVSYAVVISHIPLTPPLHVYLMLYDIPATTNSISDAVSGVGLFGHNTVNNLLAYTPPCSQGPGVKLYTITVYALSAAPVFTVASSAVTRDLFLAAVANTILATAAIDVTYTR